MKRRFKSSAPETSPNPMKKDEETSKHEAEQQDLKGPIESDIFLDKRLFKKYKFSTPCSLMKIRRRELLDLGEPSTVGRSYESQSNSSRCYTVGFDQPDVRERSFFPASGNRARETIETNEGAERQSDSDTNCSISSLNKERRHDLHSDFFYPEVPMSLSSPEPSSAHHSLNAVGEDTVSPSNYISTYHSPSFMDSSSPEDSGQRRFQSYERDAEQVLQEEEQSVLLDLSLPTNTEHGYVAPTTSSYQSINNTYSSLQGHEWGVVCQKQTSGERLSTPWTDCELSGVLNIPALLTHYSATYRSSLLSLKLRDVDYREQDTSLPQFNYQEEIKESVGPVDYSVPNRSARTDLPHASESGFRRRDFKNSSCSPSFFFIDQEPPDVSNLRRAASLPNMKLQSSFEDFTPGFSGDEDDETYWFQCSRPGLYQCRVSGLVFDMKGGGDVFYRVVPWNRRSLSQHGKKPAGPLFDISCQQQSVAQLHLPHCEVRSTGGCHFLSVAHLHNEGIDFIRPERITETHVIISISGFSAFGNVKDEDSPPDPVRALVLLFYKPPADPDVTSFLNVLLLPENIVIRDVKRTRKKLFGLETFIDAPPNCKLRPKQLYSLSTSPGGDSVLVQPTEAEFDAESYNNYFTSIQVILNSIIGDIKLSVKEKNTSCCVWERHVCLLAHRVKTGLPPDEQLKETRTRIIDGISGPVLQSLLDKLLEKKVLSDSEREAVEGEKIRGDKARVLVDTVRRKGDAASSEMIHFLCELDQFLCKHVGLICDKVEPNQ